MFSGKEHCYAVAVYWSCKRLVVERAVKTLKSNNLVSKTDKGIRRGINCQNLFFRMGFPGDIVVKNPPECRTCKKHRLDPWVRKIPWSRKWLPAPVTEYST